MADSGKDTPTPDGEPYTEGAIVESYDCMLRSSSEFDDRLGMTRFEKGSAELNRKIDPGSAYTLHCLKTKRFTDTHLFTNLFMLLA